MKRSILLAMSLLVAALLAVGLSSRARAGGMARRAGIAEPLPRFHDTRHAFASHALAAGLTAHAVAALLGHADAGLVLRRYGHALPDELARAGAALSTWRAARVGTTSASQLDGGGPRGEPPPSPLSRPTWKLGRRIVVDFARGTFANRVPTNDVCCPPSPVLICAVGTLLWQIKLPPMRCGLSVTFGISRDCTSLESMNVPGAAAQPAGNEPSQSPAGCTTLRLLERLTFPPTVLAMTPHQPPVQPWIVRFPSIWLSLIGKL